MSSGQNYFNPGVKYTPEHGGDRTPGDGIYRLLQSGTGQHW